MISSPEASATPVTRPSREVIAATSAPQRISAPAARAAAASASDSGARPADREHGLARRAAVVAGRVERAASPSIPADHGPSEQYWTPRQAIAAWTRVGLERLRDEVGDRHRQDAQDRVGVVLAEAAERPAELQPGQGVAEARRA